jgi:hypothetical protein
VQHRQERQRQAQRADQGDVGEVAVLAGERERPDQLGPAGREQHARARHVEGEQHPRPTGAAAAQHRHGHHGGDDRDRQPLQHGGRVGDGQGRREVLPRPRAAHQPGQHRALQRRSHEVADVAQGRRADDGGGDVQQVERRVRAAQRAVHEPGDAVAAQRLAQPGDRPALGEPEQGQRHQQRQRQQRLLGEQQPRGHRGRRPQRIAQTA